MVNEFKYQAETFDICVDGKIYPVSTSKLFLIQRMQDTCDELSKEEKPDIPGFMEKIYEILKKILGEDTFNAIIEKYEYDLIHMIEFCTYLAKEASPHMQSVLNRLSKVSQKYNKENLNEPADTQIATNG